MVLPLDSIMESEHKCETDIETKKSYEVMTQDEQRFLDKPGTILWV
jgi:hypothetical protein